MTEGSNTSAWPGPRRGNGEISGCPNGRINSPLFTVVADFRTCLGAPCPGGLKSGYLIGQSGALGRSRTRRCENYGDRGKIATARRARVTLKPFC